jgi:hypothetical protein
MQITVTIPDDKAAQIVNGLCAATGWVTESGVTKNQWAKDKLAQWIKDTAKRGLARASMTTIAADIDPTVIS